jgi:hypothetical protein
VHEAPTPCAVSKEIGPNAKEQSARPDFSDHCPEEWENKNRTRLDRLDWIRLTNVHRNAFLIKQHQPPLGVTKNQAAIKM